jgi:hypothetical protein
VLSTFPNDYDPLAGLRLPSHPLDKVSRITNLVERGKKGDAPAVVDESLIDTFRDLSCYALICIELYEDHCARSA